ncbi:hypothetical protein ES319_A05G401500v1 [Gossypium barbadense]|uniref:DUF3741 domain-containing protein n=1 Tax=Gossypium barbadense TaxID=3634 RepID=A0A5J5VZC4_GOSBA|nr:hypothetical protein ES319_A05G401500v1 [Gossypium barbadense]KAB2085498.1 hypothetical protein ES319_A05G401500v1 [Gossypium barbadense]
MELKDLQSDLEALRELYGLIRYGDVTSNVILGERSKLLLKDLLDGATKRVLETHIKIIAEAEHGICGNTFSSESGKWLVESRPCVSSNILNATPDVIRDSVKESKHPAFSSSKDEDYPNQLTTHEVISQQSRFTLDKSENRKKNCEFNKKSSMKQHSTAKILSKDAKQQGWQCDPLGHFYQAIGDDKNLSERNETNMELLKSNETMRQSSICGLRGIESVSSSSNSVASGDNLADLYEKGGEAVNNFSKDIDNVVKHIESHISALRLLSKLAEATKAPMPTSVYPMVQAKEHLVKKNELSHDVDPFSDRDDMQLIGLVSQRNGKKDDSNGICHVLGQSTNDLLDEITSKRRRIQHKEMGQTCNHIVRSDSRVNKKTGNWNVSDMLEADGYKQNENTGCYVHGLRIPTKQDDITKRSPMPVKTPFPISIDRGKESSPTISKLRSSPPYQSTESKALSHKRSLAHEILPKQEKGGMGILRHKILLHQQEPEESSTSGSGSSGSSDNEAYSLLSEDSSTSMSSRFDHGAREESSSSSISSDYRDASESDRLHPSRTHKLIHPTDSEPEKAEGRRVGRLRKITNKLGLIFHHHHHHHHHRYNHHDSGDRSHGAHTKSLWTPLHKIFHPRNRNEVDEGKLRKAKASNAPVKHQVGHFHALVDGLMQHLRHSKQSKASKSGMGWLGKNQHKENRKVKQLHWWQMFQRQGGVKLPNRRRVKVGFMSKKKQLRVPKLK